MVVDSLAEGEEAVVEGVGRKYFVNVTKWVFLRLHW